MRLAIRQAAPPIRLSAPSGSGLPVTAAWLRFLAPDGRHPPVGRRLRPPRSGTGIPARSEIVLGVAGLRLR
jgi:hypothetical protein